MLTTQVIFVALQGGYGPVAFGVFDRRVSDLAPKSLRLGNITRHIAIFYLVSPTTTSVAD